MIKILDYTGRPLVRIGEYAATCYNTTIKGEGHKERIAKHCIDSGHNRLLEFVDVTLEITCSARCAREWYTHIGGSPTRVQASTRYITYDNFDYFIPDELSTEQRLEYKTCMKAIQMQYKKLKELNTPNDITGYLLPLAMNTTFIWKGNLRTLENMFSQRLCTRALPEYTELMELLKEQLMNINDEWKWLGEKLFKPKCYKLGHCPENKPSCHHFYMVGN